MACGGEWPFQKRDPKPPRPPGRHGLHARTRCPMRYTLHPISCGPYPIPIPCALPPAPCTRRPTPNTRRPTPYTRNNKTIPNQTSEPLVVPPSSTKQGPNGEPLTLSTDWRPVPPVTGPQGLLGKSLCQRPLMHGTRGHYAIIPSLALGIKVRLGKPTPPTRPPSPPPPSSRRS